MPLSQVDLLTRSGEPLVTNPSVKIVKDPCPVFDGSLWHIFSTGCVKRGGWQILHATAEKVTGPWTEQQPAILQGAKGSCVTAPGVVYSKEEKCFHMFIQTTCFNLGGEILHLTSESGDQFELRSSALYSLLHTSEAGIYDPHPAELNGKKYISYSGMAQPGRPDLYLAESLSNTWYGPWMRVGCILEHQEVLHHNQHDNPHYEWGLEGSQLLELPDGTIMLNAVCFLPEGKRGTRQRVFFASANTPEGPYLTWGPVLTPTQDGWESGENGHAAAVLLDETIHLFYQAQNKLKWDSWKLGYAQLEVEEVVHFAHDVHLDHTLSQVRTLLDVVAPTPSLNFSWLGFPETV
jgi:hypothetical protein